MRLTDFSQFAGCGAKLGPGLLDKALCGLTQATFPNLICDFSHAEDCGVYRLTDEIALVQTIDFFPPVCDDPWTFGRIAAANALSDIYAMGADPVTAVSVVCFPDKRLDISFLREIMEGALDALAESKTALVGGHTIRDNEVKFGLCVNGTIPPDRVLHNNGWHAGDALILTKPLGGGIVQNAVRAAIADASEEREVLEHMMRLNREASQVFHSFALSACTDITGFGLLGHLCEMGADTGLRAEVDIAALPLFSHARTYAEMGLIPAGAYTNLEYRGRFIENLFQVEDAMGFVLFCPETSGGLIAALPESESAFALKALSDRGISAARIGSVTPGEQIKLLL